MVFRFHGSSEVSDPYHWWGGAKRLRCTMHCSDHHGIPLFWQDGPGPLSGGLLFGVGAQDETFRTRQVTHVIEHLVMGAFVKSRFENNATVQAASTLFYATGSTGQVSDFLSAVAAAVSALPVEGLSRELGVLDAEGGTSAHPSLGWTAAMRYGNAGVGLLGDQGPPIDQLRLEDVLDYAGRYFVAGNAALIFTGPPPDGRHVSLPAGDRTPRSPSTPTPLPLPGYIRDEVPWPVLSFLLPADNASWVLPSILKERILDDLRHKQGISYSVDGDHVLVNGQILVALTPDGREGHEKQVTEALWRSLTDLAEHGPTPAELVEAVEAARIDLEDPWSTFENLMEAATRHLSGQPRASVHDRLIEAAAVGIDDVQQMAKYAVSTTLMAVPEDVEPDLRRLNDLTDDELPSDAPVTGETFKRKALCFAPRDLRVVAGEAGISLTALSKTTTASWPEVVGVATTKGDRGIVLTNGLNFEVCDKHLKDTQRLFAIIDEHAAERLFSVEGDFFH